MRRRQGKPSIEDEPAVYVRGEPRIIRNEQHGPWLLLRADAPEDRFAGARMQAVQRPVDNEELWPRDDGASHEDLLDLAGRQGLFVRAHRRLEPNGKGIDVFFHLDEAQGP